MEFRVIDRVEKVGRGVPPLLHATLDPDNVNELIEKGLLPAANRDQRVPYTILGHFLAPRTGMVIASDGEFEIHEKWGLQFKASAVVEVRPTSRRLITDYFENAKIPELPPGIVAQLLELFDKGIYAALSDPDRLTSVGVNSSQALKISRAWTAFSVQHDLQAYMVELGLPTEASRVARNFHSAAEMQEFLALAKQDPYRIVDQGVEFEAIDAQMIARGTKRTAPERIVAAAVQVYEDAFKNGNTVLPQWILEQEVRKIAAVPPQVYVPLIEEALRCGDRLVSIAAGTQSFVNKPANYETERKIADGLQRLNSGKSDVLMPISAEDIAAMESEEYNAEQIQAVANAFRSPVTIITGGPGVGKTKTLKKIFEVATSQGARVALNAPIGKAARRMTESTGHKATTTHALLGIKPDQSYTNIKPIEQELVIIDEFSLADMELAAALIRALKPGQHLVIVGDTDQLRSIGAGNVLGDLIDSGLVSTTRLWQNYRQDEQSTILSVAQEINSGVMPTTWDGQCWFDQCSDEQIAPRIAKLINRCIDQGYEPKDIIVLSGLRKGTDLALASVDALNPYLQDFLNPPSDDKPQIYDKQKGQERIFRLGDRVIFGLNDETRDLVNGDIGTIKHVDRGSKALTIEFNGSLIRLEKWALKDLDLAYANTIQKFQGDQAKVVIEAISIRHKRVLSRNLVYTGLTRAQKKVAFVGDRAALEFAVTKSDNSKRMTGLSILLAEKKAQLGIASTLQFETPELERENAYSNS